MSSLLQLNILDDSVHDQPKYVQRLCARFYSMSARTRCSYIITRFFSLTPEVGIIAKWK